MATSGTTWSRTNDRSKPNFRQRPPITRRLGRPQTSEAGEGPIRADDWPPRIGIAKLRSLGYLGSTPRLVPNAKDAAKAPSRRRNPRPEPKEKVQVGAEPRVGRTPTGPMSNAGRLQRRSRSNRRERARRFSRVSGIIDHSTTTAEAASHQGGRSGKGGDLLYRWGNPPGVSERFEDGAAPVSTSIMPTGSPHGPPRAKAISSSFNNGSRPAGRGFPRRSTNSSFPWTRQGQYARNRRGPVWADPGGLELQSAPKKSDFYSFFHLRGTATPQPGIRSSAREPPARSSR